ncbi:MAG TPA: polysaccharide biosynthesis/export family protein [Candidatus Binatia bacterium]|jgi:polysaccharide export outer membrane protein|nr:polysaccharide biosynthesis/export family protein [Candidatus Binatia bacterium]
MRSDRITVGLCLLVSVAMGGCGSQVDRNTTLATPPQAGSQSPPSSVNEINKALSLTAAQSTSSTADYRIGPDDLVQITIYNIPEQDARVTPRMIMLRVSQQGKIVIPLVGELQVKDMTTREVEGELRIRYAKYIRTPQVGVMITEIRQRVSVMGAVQKPGVVELTGPKSVIDVLALAGGVTERAGNQVHVYRQDNQGGRQSIVIDLMLLANNAGAIGDDKSGVALNSPLQAGDVVNVPQAGMFFVDGAVGKPGSYPLGRNYTLSQALAMAGGINPELADYAAVSINRRHGPNKMETIAVDLNTVMAGAANDPQVLPDDVILVPMSSFKYFVKRFIGTIISGVSVGSFVGGS